MNGMNWRLYKRPNEPLLQNCRLYAAMEQQRATCVLPSFLPVHAESNFFGDSCGHFSRWPKRGREEEREAQGSICHRKGKGREGEREEAGRRRGHPQLATIGGALPPPQISLFGTGHSTEHRCVNMKLKLMRTKHCIS